MGELEIFANRIKQLRKSLGMTQKDFSEYIGVKQQTLSGYERGIMKPPLDIAKNIAEKCNVSIDWLCGLSDKKSIGNEIITYSDVIEFLFRLEQSKIGLEVLEIPKIDCPLFNSMADIPVIVFNNMKMCHFLWDYVQVKDAKDNMAIKEHLYNLWAQDILEEYNTELQYDGIAECSPKQLAKSVEEAIRAEQQKKPDEPPQE